MSRGRSSRRTVRLVQPASSNGVAVICITIGSRSTFYAVREIPCEIGGRGFALHKLGMGTLYHVRVGETIQNCSCECLGFLRHGYCKHVLGLLALTRPEKDFSNHSADVQYRQPSSD